jgi:hypothetical protein
VWGKTVSVLTSGSPTVNQFANVHRKLCTVLHRFLPTTVERWVKVHNVNGLIFDVPTQHVQIVAVVKLVFWHVPMILRHAGTGVVDVSDNRDPIRKRFGVCGSGTTMFFPHG